VDLDEEFPNRMGPIRNYLNEFGYISYAQSLPKRSPV